MNIKEQIIEYIKKNRVSTTEIADCMGKTGAVENVSAINRGHFRVGEVKWVYAYEESNWSIHEQIVDVEENKLIFVQTFNCGKRAAFGELVSKYLLLYRQSVAIVVNGYMRDAAALIKENYPIWCKGFNPVGCFNKKPQTDLDADLIKTGKMSYEGSIAVCDDCGVVLITNEYLNENMLEALKKIELQEDIWFDRLDRYKENTFEIVCQKKYLNDYKI